MAIPSKVKVGGMEYIVNEVENVIIDKEVCYNGSCNSTKLVIELKSDLPVRRKEQVFLHELVHAIMFEAGYDSHDEDLVDRISIVLHQVLRDNQEVI